MKLCNETVTVVNTRIDSATGKETYQFSVIKGVSWFCEIASSVDNAGLHAANRFIVRIPANADFVGKSYIDPVGYDAAQSVSGLFTLRNGDVIVKANITDTTLKPAQLHERYSDCMTILGITDNRRAPNAKHWRVVGQ